jgi:hypothetical protein
MPTPTPGSTVAPTAFTWDIGGEGAPPSPGSWTVLDNQFKTSNNDFDVRHGDFDGDFMPTDPGAKSGGGGQGPLGNMVDGISCDATMSNNYHVHAYVGLFVNGNQIVMPDAIGIVHAAGDTFDAAENWPNQELYGDCFYHIHTHDESGLIHLEDPNPTGASINQSIFTINQLFDIWGIQVSPFQFGPFNGPVTVFTSGQFSRAVPSSCRTAECYEVGSNMYTQWTGDPTQVPLYSHEVIWFLVGSGNPDVKHLPGVSFAIQQ